VIADVAHRIDGLPRGARRDEHAEPGQLLTLAGAGGAGIQERGELRRLQHAPLADLSAGLIAAAGAQ
jgi:hypothetical protein